VKSKIAVILVIIAFFTAGCSGENTNKNADNTEQEGANYELNEQQLDEQEIIDGQEIMAELDGDNIFNLSNLPEGESLEEIFTTEGAVGRTEQISAALNSFRLLTEKAAGKISDQEIAQIGNTGWEIQYLGFYNWTNTVLGTLLLQDYEIKRLELKLAGAELKAGEIDKKDFELKEAEYKEAKDKVQQFLNSYTIAD